MLTTPIEANQRCVQLSCTDSFCFDLSLSVVLVASFIMMRSRSFIVEVAHVAPTCSEGQKCGVARCSHSLGLPTFLTYIVSITYLLYSPEAVSKAIDVIAQLNHQNTSNTLWCAGLPAGSFASLPWRCLSIAISIPLPKWLGMARDSWGELQDGESACMHFLVQCSFRCV